MYIPYNPNPVRNYVGDCVIRAISKVTNKDWDTTYLNVAMQGFAMKEVIADIQLKKKPSRRWKK